MSIDAAIPAVGLKSRDRASCSHCGLPVAPGCIDPESREQFCCDGCRSVYAILHDVGLEAYYSHREATGAEAQPGRTTGRRYEELDDPVFFERHVRLSREGLASVELYLEGVHCSACVWLVEKLPNILEGVIEARLDLARATVRIFFDPAAVRLAAVARALDRIGYPPHPKTGTDATALRRRQDRALLARIGVAGAAAGNAMLMATALYSGAFEGMERTFVQLFRWGSLLVSVPAVLWSGSVFFKGALSALRTLTPHMDLPITVGILAGTTSGVVNTIRSSGDIYFDSVTALIFLLLVGRFLQQRQQRTAENASELLSALAPSTARWLEGENLREVPVETLPIGAVVEVRAGDPIPIDGTVIEGRSQLDTSLLTGESMPAEIATGESVHAGSINLSARLLVRAETTGGETRVAGLVKTLRDAARHRAPIALLADRIAGVFVVAVLALAAATFALWSWLDPSRALDHAVALLVVSCPCALGLATPLAVSAALGRAARRGLLIKGGAFLEALARPSLVVFDKTGTLTSGRVTMMDYAGDPTIRRLVLALARHSAHPIARAFVAALSGEPEAPVEQVTETLGGGLEGRAEGRQIRIGSLGYIESQGCVSSWARAQAHRYATRGWTPVLVAVDGDVVALAGFGDPVRPEAALSLRSLRDKGYRLALLSGDRREVVEAVAGSLGISFDEVVAEASPEQKLAFVEEAATRGPVFMVGDGVNDAGALARATVGVAVHGGAEASLAAADVLSRRDGLGPVVEAISGARRTMTVVRRGLGFSLAYNLFAAVLAVTGLIGPLTAAILMPLSSLTVVTNAYRSKTFTEAT